MTWLAVVIGAMVGAPLRYLTDRFIHTRSETTFPLGTFAVNVSGCFILGLVVGAAHARAASPELELLIGTGFCGALTSYSTFSHQTLELAENGSPLLALVNAAASVLAGLAAAFAGGAAAHLLWP